LCAYIGELLIYQLDKLEVQDRVQRYLKVNVDWVNHDLEE
jgi:hypothetical protein